MALWGQIYVNTEHIGEWEAVRKEKVPDTQETFNYRCKVVTTGLVPREWEGTVAHTYGDGPVVLMAKILNAANKAVHEDP